MGITALRLALAGLALATIVDASATAAPTITSFSPTSGTIGNKVIITGTAFTGATAVKFGGVVAIYTVNSATQITATVPNSASTGFISVTAGGSTVTSTTKFAVTPGMGLSFAAGHPYISPTVYGAGFHPSTAVDFYFDNQNAALFVSSPTGTLSTVYQIPGSAQPGQHWLTFVERGSNLAAQKAFIVQTDWAEEGFGQRGLGFNPYENTINTGNVATLTSAWSVNSGGTSNDSPFVIAGSNVYIGDAFGIIRAYSPKGALMWTASPGADMESLNPAAAGGRVFFGDVAGNVRSYSQTCRSDGGVCTPQWTTNLGSGVYVSAGLTFHNGTLYVPATDGTVHTLNPTSGVQGTALYAYNSTYGAITTPIAFDVDGSFFYGTGYVFQYHLSNGTQGVVPYYGNVSPIAVNSGAAYFTTNDGMVHRWSPSLPWDVPTSGTGCAAAPVVALGFVYAGGCSNLSAYVPKTGALSWSNTTGPIQGISEANGVLYACEGTPPYNGNVEAYSASYGGYYWTGNQCISAIEVANGKVFAADANLTAYDFPTAIGGVQPAPAISSLHPNYSLKPQISGTPVASRTPPELSME